MGMSSPFIEVGRKYFGPESSIINNNRAGAASWRAKFVVKSKSKLKNNLI